MKADATSMTPESYEIKFGAVISIMRIGCLI
jgi:hypothetical protein